LAGWDSDCNPATAGGLIGIVHGFSGLPNDLVDPNICSNVYKNAYRPYLPDPNLYRPQYDTITNIASRLVALAEQNILEPNNYLDPNNAGYVTGSGPTKTYHIPEPNTIMPEPEKPDPNGPSGLVAEAMASGITITTSAAVEYHNPTSDPRNLDAIINGITDNSYNGHKAYYSYLWDPAQRPKLDWYQLNFSQPVKFEALTFYEGDLRRRYIDPPKGGFFEELTVEIRRDGRFIEPANLSMAPQLDAFSIYQRITFTFAPTVGDAIRIIGTPGGTQGFTTIMELEAQGDINPGLYIASVEIADGQVQRSNVDGVLVEFSRNVTVGLSDIQLLGTTNATTFDANRINFTYDSLSFQLTLKFDTDNDGSFGDSLPDDTYQLKLDCSSITDANGQTLLDDDQNPSDSFYTIEFHRLFGDADGSAAVDFTDFSLLALYWLDAPADTGLDSNADNILNLLDLAAFTENWLAGLAY